MGSLSAAAALQLPVQLDGRQLGRPTDLLLDVHDWHALGFVVLCGDESIRFLPYGAAQLARDEIAVKSALMLLEDVEFYERRGSSFRGLRGGDVDGRGTLRDLLLGTGGRVEALEIERGGRRRQVRALGSTVVPTRASAA